MTLAFFEISGQEIILISILSALLPLLCIIDIVRSDFKDSTTKLLWVLVVLFIAFIGPLVYLIIGRGTKIKSSK
ncbi:PLDc N-terminal domain-containing protein [Mucilaginibacter antarcticus]|uniref:PLDc N-terminal domain-containing protein n=1 Tax=Mucilaginibacter antarcticus TaxID=1855725 RepID=A0ABW5XRS2_9SPHI